MIRDPSTHLQIIFSGFWNSLLWNFFNLPISNFRKKFPVHRLYERLMATFTKFNKSIYKRCIGRDDFISAAKSAKVSSFCFLKKHEWFSPLIRLTFRLAGLTSSESSKLRQMNVSIQSLYEILCFSLSISFQRAQKHIWNVTFYMASQFFRRIIVNYVKIIFVF